ncbi:MAG: excinuclease ABC subunit UvrA [Pseudomonadota bacterium]
MSDTHIRVKGARQNNLKNVNIDLPLNELIVITGVSGSGKSSLAFDTVYAEGQRRYVETFSPYARQFLDRMDKPATDQIDGIPPAIAIDQTNPVRTSRSTVGTMTELNDHLKLLYARVSNLICDGCHQLVEHDSPEAIWKKTLTSSLDRRIAITFIIQRPDNFSSEEMHQYLAAQGYLRILSETDNEITVVQDRLRIRQKNKTRFIESLEAAFRRGHGRVQVADLDDQTTVSRYSSRLHCANCDLSFTEPVPSLFSFNSPLGACETCRGFGRTMGIDMSLVLPNPELSINDGLVKPWQTKSYAGCQRDLKKFAAARGIDLDRPFSELSDEDQKWIIEGEGKRRSRKWYGVRGFFTWLETKAYKMHVRVMLARYRSYDLCVDCNGTRLKPEALRWRLGKTADSPSIHDLMLWPLEHCRGFFESLQLPAPLDEAADMLLEEIRSRLRFLNEVGLSYLTLDRQSRTLSGGEVQRINLTTALGTSLVNTLFVLDEPSIGLHPRDIDRIAGVMQRLRDAGNSLLVVEHDPQIIMQADRVIDMGPGPGELGGEVIFDGTAKELRRSKTSLTAPYINGERQVTTQIEVRPVARSTPRIHLQGACEHNLKDVTLKLPLNRLAVVTGVSGSGKSTLLETVLFRALKRALGTPKDIPGEFKSLRGHELIGDVVLVDQSAIGKTTRSNPASFVGAFDAIRKRFVAEPLSIERGYTPGTFSFNSGNGRCAECGGNGFEHVEMQFLSDVYLRCASCNGRRYRDEILEVTVRDARAGGGSLSIADVLEMTADEALGFFGNAKDIQSSLHPLQAVGLGYLRLGQPVPTLSGGEAQRLKLARHLVAARGKKKLDKPLLFIFDEPTTGLHFQDIEVLLIAFNELIDQGHSVAIIEHNLDVIAAADWVIDLGPEGGEGGGNIVFEGPPSELIEAKGNATATALRQYRDGKAIAPAVRKKRKPGKASIQIHKARENNLRNIDLSIPREKFTVITGVSGSGKSTIAFDIVFNEGQRRYLESLNAYARQFVQPAARPDVDAVTGIPPTVAIEQRTSRGGRKSTVGTMTEVHHFLRLLFMRLGTQHCPDCDIAISAQTKDQVAAHILKNNKPSTVQLFAPLVTARKGYYTDLAKWAAKKGFDFLRVDGELQPTKKWPRLSRYKNHDIELPIGELVVNARNEKQLRALLDDALDYGKGLVIVVDKKGSETLHSIKRACPSCQRSFDEPDPRLYSYNSAYGWCTDCTGTGLAATDEDEAQSVLPCPGCQGARLNPIALAVRFAGDNIAQFSTWPIEQALRFFNTLKLNKRDAAIARDLIVELRNRLRFLDNVGLSYLSLDRAAPTLSGGEAQRIRLAAQLGSNLRGVCYILDEPTIGLHARDNARLLETLKGLKKNGNSVVVVEHDEDTIRAAEHIIDIGPGAGVRGGQVVAQGSVDKIKNCKASLTGQLLRKPLQHPFMPRREISVRGKNAELIQVRQASLHNLKKLNLKLPGLLSSRPCL